MKGNYSKRQIDEAARWVLLHEDGISEEQIAEFEEWKRSYPLNEACFFETQMGWSSLDSMRFWKPELSDDPNPDLFVDHSHARVKFRFPIVSLAACILILLALLINNPNPAPSSSLKTENYVQHYEGGKKHYLNDGSSFYLKQGSQIQVSFSDQSRDIYLKSGEAIFDVAHDPLRPFVVYAENTKVMAVGTIFSVNSDAGYCEVYVTEGKVRLSEKTAISVEGREAKPLVSELKAGQKVSVPVSEWNEVPEVESFSAEEYANKVVWKNQIIDMVSAPLYEIIEEFNKHNSVDIHIQDYRLREVRMSVSVRPDSQDEFLRLLELTLGVHVEVSEGGIYVYPKN
jgi:transmembrane sensor